MNTQPQQHLTALEKANRIRLARAKIKREIAAGEFSAARVLREVPYGTESMPVSELLMAQRRWGKTKMRRVLLMFGIPENKQVGTMTERQRTHLAETLDPSPPSMTVEYGDTRNSRKLHILNPDDPMRSLCGRTPVWSRTRRKSDRVCAACTTHATKRGGKV